MFFFLSACTETLTITIDKIEAKNVIIRYPNGTEAENKPYIQIDFSSIKPLSQYREKAMLQFQGLLNTPTSSVMQRGVVSFYYQEKPDAITADQNKDIIPPYRYSIYIFKDFKLDYDGTTVIDLTQDYYHSIWFVINISNIVDNIARSTPIKIDRKTLISIISQFDPNSKPITITDSGSIVDRK